MLKSLQVCQNQRRYWCCSKGVKCFYIDLSLLIKKLLSVLYCFIITIILWNVGLSLSNAFYCSYTITKDLKVLYFTCWYIVWLSKSCGMYEIEQRERVFQFSDKCLTWKKINTILYNSVIEHLKSIVIFNPSNPISLIAESSVFVMCLTNAQQGIHLTPRCETLETWVN